MMIHPDADLSVAPGDAGESHPEGRPEEIEG